MSVFMYLFTVHCFILMKVFCMAVLFIWFT